MSKILIGTVASDKPDKTIIVSVQTRKTHPIYKKQYTVNKRFAAHDEKNEAKTGDEVSIMETRPLSASKKFNLEKILKKAALKKEDREAIQGEDNSSDKLSPQPSAPNPKAIKGSAK